MGWGRSKADSLGAARSAAFIAKGGAAQET